MPTMTRLAAAAVIGVLAVGGTLYLMQRGQPAVGGPDATPTVSASPSSPTPTATPGLSPTLPAGFTGPLGDGRQIHTATRLGDGRVLVAGGYTTGDGSLASTVLFDPSTGTFNPTGSLTSTRGLHTATLLADGRVLTTGGGVASWVFPGPYLNSAELYDPMTGTFADSGSMATAREDHTATLLADGRVLIAGGNDYTDHGTASAELYDPTTGAFTSTGSLSTARGFHTATLLLDGRVLIAGGDTGAWSNPGPFLASAEIYDPAKGIFTPTGSMRVGRFLAAATLLSDGRVLITGGVENDGSTSLASAELYDPATGTFSPTGSMVDGRVFHTATRLADGRVLVAGGCANGRDYARNPQFLASAELYDPETGTFTATGPMADRRTWQAATPLLDGRVLVTGGASDSATLGVAAPLASAELYDPQTGTFSPAGVGD